MMVRGCGIKGQVQVWALLLDTCAACSASASLRRCRYQFLLPGPSPKAPHKVTCVTTHDKARAIVVVTVDLKDEVQCRIFGWAHADMVASMGQGIYAEAPVAWMLHWTSHSTLCLKTTTLTLARTPPE